MGVSSATIGNYEQGTREPRNNETWQKLANFFNISVDELMDKDNNIRYSVKIGCSTSPSKKDWTQQYRTDTKIIYNDVDITPLVNADYGERTPVTRDQQYAYTEYLGRSGHVLYARKKLLNVLNEIHSKSTNEISDNLSDIIEYIEKYVVYWYKKCWNNIDALFPTANSLDTLYDLLNKCICVDMIAQQEFTLISIDEDFDWLREKLHS
ncbi:MAG: helix-turn-helix transcriptional regulator [Eubacterium sp.]|nr:helix-turn-helix transcriptional regulator [Eubacterium sp.]